MDSRPPGLHAPIRTRDTQRGRQPLPLQLLWLGALLLALIWSTVLWESRRIHQDHLDKFRSELVHLSEVLDVALVRQIESLDNALLILRSEYLDNPQDINRTIRLLREGPFRDFEVQVSVIGTNGYPKFTDVPGHPAPAYLGDRAHFRVFADGGPDQLYISDPVMGRMTKRWGLQLARPLLGKDGRFLGVMVIFLPPEQLTRFIQTLDIGTDTIMSVLSARGALISRSVDLEKYRDSRMDAAQLVEYQSQRAGYSLRHSILDQVERGIAHRWIDTYPLLLVVSRSPDTAHTEIRGLKEVLFLLGGMISLVVIGALWLLGRAMQQHRQDDVELRIAAKAFQTQEGMFVTDENGVVLRINSAFTEITGYTAEDIVGKNPRLRSSGRQDAAFYSAMWARIRATGSWKGEMWNRRKNGEVYPESVTITAVKGADEAVTHYVATMHDISERKAAEEQTHTLAFYDALTQLPNRRLLHDRLQQTMLASMRNGHHGALLFIDLDRFKQLNDTLGHDYGDLLLQQVALRLKECVRQADTVARLGGDEFVVLLEELSPEATVAQQEAIAVGQKILASLNRPYDLSGHAHLSTPSIGATIFCGLQNSREELIKQADLAMYKAKSAGRNTLCFFDPTMLQQDGETTSAARL
ncbi:MAG: diguanylate cyclase [Burkholderiales bacterium]|nr:diguanylate cyclase [Burkholderiales bacterium]